MAIPRALRRSGCRSSRTASPIFPGPLAGILAALDWAAANRPDVKLVLSAAADCPFLPRDLVSRLHGALEGRECRACRCRLRRPVPSGDRIMERRLARTAAPRAGRRGRQEDRPLDRTLQTRHRDMAGRRRSIRSSTPTPWTTSRRPSGWRRWTAAEPRASRPTHFFRLPRAAVFASTLLRNSCTVLTDPEFAVTYPGSAATAL